MTTDLAIAAIKAQALWDAGEQLRRQAAELHPEFARMLDAPAYPTREAYEAACAALEKHRSRAEAAERKIRATERIQAWTNEDGKRFVFLDDLAVALEIPGVKTPTYCGATGTHSPTSVCGVEMPCDEHAEED